MKRAIQMLGALALVAGFFTLGAPAAHAQTVPTCNSVSSVNMKWPADGTTPQTTHMFLCTSISQQRLNGLLGTYQSLVAVVPQNLRPGNILDNQNVFVFHFRDRNEANAYFQNTSPWSSHSGFVTTTARCGNTAYFFLPNGTYGIAIATYDRCTIGGVVQSPQSSTQLAATALHEAGHGYDFAIAAGQSSGPGTNAPSLSSGYVNLAKATSTGDLDKLTPPTWATMTQAQKNSYVCNIFSNLTPSSLEVDLGASAGAVCESGGSGLQIKTAYQGMTPTAIVKQKGPYFFNPAAASPPVPEFSELWAQEFAIKSQAQNPTNFLQMTNRIITTNSAPVPDFRCTRLVMQTYWDFLRPPTSNELTAQGCSSNPGSFPQVP
ncbi:MAG: hypothetical protein K8F91_15865 [Candidatus Obscuribacterales bacterium]|nr:hypothetical protein [Candidatus Obscuribacterales bacterium]